MFSVDGLLHIMYDIYTHAGCVTSKQKLWCLSSFVFFLWQEDLCRYPNKNIMQILEFIL